MKIVLTVVSAVAIAVAVAAIALGTTAPNSSSENMVRVAFFPNIGHSIAIVGTEKGIFSEKLGNQIQIETRLFDSGPQVIESMYANQIDLAYVGPGPAINGFLKSDGKALKILTGAASAGVSFVVHPDSKIQSVTDFVGKRIAAPQIGNTQDISLRNFLYQNNLKPMEKGGSVYVINVINPDIFTLFAKGDLDAAWVPEPWATRLVQQLGGIRLFQEKDLWDDKKFSSVVLIVRSDYLIKHPDIVQKWIEAHVQTSDWINAHADETEIIFNEFLKKKTGKTIPTEILHEAFSNLQFTTDPIESSIYTFAERAYSLGYLGREGYDLEGIFYTQPFESVKEELMT
ncbi:MAG TPA: ABC transporter substrate-binding protein [Nitrosopumilaceae archaeon]|nr:ABC transporter substrate-binding protein [Nitrosopumilaceae archaeon]